MADFLFCFLSVGADGVPAVWLQAEEMPQRLMHPLLMLADMHYSRTQCSKDDVHAWLTLEGGLARQALVVRCFPQYCSDVLPNQQRQLSFFLRWWGCMSEPQNLWYSCQSAGLFQLVLGYTDEKGQDIT